MTLAAFLRLTRLMLVALLALALTASAFAHRMPADPERLAPDALAFLQETGANPADICGDPDTGTQGKPVCEACHIASLLPPTRPVARPVALVLATDAPVLPQDARLLPAPRRDPAHLPQAPPVA